MCTHAGREKKHDERFPSQHLNGRNDVKNMFEINDRYSDVKNMSGFKYGCRTENVAIATS